MQHRDVTRDQDWEDIRELWSIRSDTTYLNHGSFGPPPISVNQARETFSKELAEQPMDFFLRQYEPRLEQARKCLAEFVGTRFDDLVFCENATYGMNIVANSFPLEPGDEVLLTNHEYGAVRRIWERAAALAEASVVTCELPTKIDSADQVVDCIQGSLTPKTRLLVFSHVTSATALVLPAREICSLVQDSEIAVCIDGPHAPAQVELNIARLGCDFYMASCHKWLNAGLGSGFLHVSEKWHGEIRAVLKSWGRLLPAIPEHWTEEFTWSGTRDPAAYLTIPVAIENLRTIGLDSFRKRASWLAGYGERQLVELTGNETWANRANGFYATMAHVRLPNPCEDLQKTLWEKYKIEVPVFEFEGQNYLRLSCHLYNTKDQIDKLVDAIRTEVFQNS